MTFKSVCPIMAKMVTSSGEIAHNCSIVIEALSHLGANGSQISFIARFALMQHKDTNSH